MTQVTMVGCDLHDRSLMLQVAVDKGAPRTRSFPRDQVPAMLDWIRSQAERHGSSRIVFAYEASGQGFGLYDELTEAGLECYVLAPTHLPHTAHHRKTKTDANDALLILEEVRAFVLAGRKLPSVWVPPRETRADRELVRLRLEVGDERKRVKNRIRAFAKRVSLSLPSWFTRSGDWSRRSLGWLHDVAAGKEASLAAPSRTVLRTWIEQYELLTAQQKRLDAELRELARSPRYAVTFARLEQLSGVGLLTAMVFLTEIGDLNRFQNRRQLGAYLGLVPSSFESGNCQDRKGHLTRQGPSRVRYVLCQAAWAALRRGPYWQVFFERVQRNTPKRRSVALVALMRKLAIYMWQIARGKPPGSLLQLLERPLPPRPGRRKSLAASPS